jgi:hypothetical protein
VSARLRRRVAPEEIEEELDDRIEKTVYPDGKAGEKTTI